MTAALIAPKRRGKGSAVHLSDRARIRAALVVACLVHFGAQSALRWSKPPVSTDAPASAENAPSSELDIDIESPAVVSPPIVDDEPVHITVRVASMIGSRAAAAGSTPEPTGQGTSTGEPTSAPEAPAPVGSAWRFSPTMPNIHPGSVELLAANGGRAEAEAPRAASTTGGLIETLDAADVERGLGRGGPVRTAIDLVARSADGPVRGAATFSVTIFSDGKIDVQVASNHTDWARIIPAIREAVRNAQVRLPPNSRGLNVVVAVDAKVKYPDGYEPPPEKTTVTADTALAVDKPLLDLKVRGRRCSAGLAVAAGGLSVGADCAVGQAARIVSTRIVSEERL